MTDVCAICGNLIDWTSGGTAVVKGAGHEHLHVRCHHGRLAGKEAQQPGGDVRPAQAAQAEGGGGQQARLVGLPHGGNDLFGRVPRQGGPGKASAHRAFVAQRPLGFDRNHGGENR